MRILAQGEFTKEEVDHGTICLESIMKGIPKTMAANFIGEFNDLFILLKAAKEKAPDEKK